MNGEDKHDWVTSKSIVAFLQTRRDNDVKVNVNGVDVPIADIYYDRTADVFRIELVRGDDYLMALTTDDPPIMK